MGRTREYSGATFGQTRRFPPQRLADLRGLLETAKKAAQRDVERRRIELADDSLSLFEELSCGFADDLIEGRFNDWRIAAMHIVPTPRALEESGAMHPRSARRKMRAIRSTRAITTRYRSRPSLP